MSFGAALAAADRAALAHLGAPILYTPEGGAPVEVRGVFDAAYQRVDLGQAGAVSSGPAVFLSLADLPSDPEQVSPTITVDGVGYTVREPQRDGMGGILLHLHRK